jgi:glyoxylate/hydroxypyruvate reductase A
VTIQADSSDHEETRHGSFTRASAAAAGRARAHSGHVACPVESIGAVLPSDDTHLRLDVAGMKVLLVTQPMPAAIFSDAIGARAPELELLEYRSALSDAELADVDAVLGWQMPAGLAARLPRAGWVCSVAAGVEKLLAPDLAPQVRVSRIVDREQAAGIAQFVVAMALRHARAFERYEAQQRERAWLRQPLPMARHSVGVLGTGAMGGEIAAWLERCGLVVRGWNRRSGDLGTVLAASEIVVCALPLTSETEGILDARAFAQMPRGAYVINVARGAHIVEADLIAAVHSGHLSGAALDVQRNEPMPASDPLWAVAGITITPHIAAQPSTETIADQFVASLRALERGEPLPNEIDRGRGY